MTLESARIEALRLRDAYRKGERDLRQAIELQRSQNQVEKTAANKVRDVADARLTATLGALLNAYVEQLRRNRKSSASAVSSAIKRHVEKPWPRLWSTPADDVTLDELVLVVAKVTNADKLTEARKLRTYLLAAYHAAIRARQDARGHPALRYLRITTNPARDLVAIDGGSNARDRALSAGELRAYWRRIERVSGPTGAMLRFHLLTGAQRVAQLARLTTADYDGDLHTVRLRDSKGRRKIARIHDVPLIRAAADAMGEMAPLRAGPYLFTVTAGASGAKYAILRSRMHRVVDVMMAAGEVDGRFTPGDLRRTVETRLAALGISPGTRAQLQSHGLGGVQSRHYDRHDYLGEKLAALETLHLLVAST